LERWGLGFERLSEANPALILVRVSGYGQTGPYAGRAGYAAVAEAMGGLRYLNGFPGEPPPRLGISLGDSLAAMFAVQGVLAALYARDHGQNRRGQAVDVSLMESCFALLESAVPEYDRLGVIREPGGTALPGVAPSNIFKSGDDVWMVIAANQDSVFARLCEAIGRPDLSTDPRFATHVARGENQDEIEAVIGDWVAARAGGDVDRILNDAGVACGPIYTIADIFADPQYRSREMLIDHTDQELGHFVGPGIVPKFSATPGGVRWSGPSQPGSHNAEVLGGLAGISESELAALEAEGVL
jgi:formyl-CoA transferase